MGATGTQRLVIILLAVLLFPLTGRGKDGAERLPVICPAVDFEDNPGRNAPIGRAFTPDLVVVGNCVLEEGDPCRGTIDVEEVLYGHTEQKRIPLESRWYLKSGRQIIAQYSSGDSTRRVDVIRSRPATPANLAGARVIAAARLACYALSAELVLVGQQVGPADPEGLDELHPFVPPQAARRLEVTRVVSGPKELEGRTLVIDLDVRSSNHNPPLAKEERIYFIGDGADRRQAPIIREYGPARTRIHTVSSALPAALADRVATVVATRETLPIEEVRQRDGPCRVRRVVHDGPVEEAILILGDEAKGAPAFVADGLVRRHPETRSLIVAAIEARMFDTTVGDTPDRRRLNRLIGILGRIEDQTRAGDLDRLVEKQIAHIEGGAPEPPEPPPSGAGPKSGAPT